MISQGSEFTFRTCADCITFMYDDGGKAKKMRGSDKIWPRPVGVLTPCFRCPKIPDDAPKGLDGHKTFYHAEEVTEKTWMTIQHYDECSAVGQFPDDPIVRRNAGVIAGFRKSSERGELKSLLLQILSMKGLP